MHVVVSRESRGQLAHFLSHLFEMLLAMMLGMFAGGALFVAATGNSTQDAIENHAVAFVSAMTAPMIAWMRHRNHPWNVCLEMSAAMVAPAIALCVLRIADVISGGVCGAYCGLSLVAMVGVMVYRRDYYSHEPLKV